ncbi:hypothetical protein GCM10020295_44830 [Streptomyces cinereospinus]
MVEAGIHPQPTGLLFGQIDVEQMRVHAFRARSVQALRTATRTHGPGGGVRLPDRSAARGDGGGGVPQPTGPVQRADPREAMEPLPRWPEKSARAGARPHSGSTPQLCVPGAQFRTDHNPAIRNNAP